MSRPIITLTTDFGTGSPYVASMKAAVLRITTEVVLIDVTHQIAPQNVRQGAIVLDAHTRGFPDDSIHVAVVDPGVGTDRRLVYARIGTQQYIAPDNGLLGRLAARERPTRIITLTEPTYWHHPVAATFHGRDVMAPVAAHLSLGLDPQRLGPRQSQLVELDWPEVHAVPGKITGEVVEVDSFGNLITNITFEQLDGVPRDAETRVCCGEHETLGIFATYAEQPEMTLVAVIGSSGALELAIVGDSAKAMLGEGVGAPVQVIW